MNEGKLLLEELKQESVCLENTFQIIKSQSTIANNEQRLEKLSDMQYIKYKKNQMLKELQNSECHQTREME